MKIVKRQSKKSIISKTGKEFKPMNFFIKTENNQYILIKPVFVEDYKRLEMVAEYEQEK